MTGGIICGGIIMNLQGESVLNKSINRFIKIYPWYTGFTSDLLFYIAIDTLFLTIVKNFSAAEIVSITSLSQLACIALQFPLLFIIKKIGNTASIRWGAFLMLLSAVFITFGKSYYIVLFGRILHDASVIMRNASVVALENVLDVAGRREDFVRVRTSGNTVYAVITMLISFVASYMFNLDNYFPMICCILACAVGFLLTLFMRDSSEYNKIAYEKKKKVKVKIHYDKIIIIAIVLYALFYSVVTNGQNEGKLFIQQEVGLTFDNDMTSLIIGAIVCFSRIVRVVSNLIFAKLYKKYTEKVGVALPILLALSIGLMLFGSFIPEVIVKILVMGIGYTVILFIRDPFKLYIQDVVFVSTLKEQHQTLITILEFGVKIATAGTGLAFSAILLAYPLLVILAIMLVIAVIEIILGIMLYGAILKGRALADN